MLCIPPALAGTLAELRMHPDLLTPEMVEPFIPLAREIDQDKDKRVAGCMRTLCQITRQHTHADGDFGFWANQEWDFFATSITIAIDHFCTMGSCGTIRRANRGSASGTSSCTAECREHGLHQFHDQMLGDFCSRRPERM